MTLPNIDFEGDTFNVLQPPIRRQRQALVSKKQIAKRERQNFNNKSLYRKNIIRKGLRGLFTLTQKQ